MKLTLNSEKLTDLGLTQSSVYLSRFLGDRVGERMKISVSAVLLPDFSNLTEAERLNAPVISLSADSIDLSQTLARKKRTHQDITLTNTGRSPLQINKLQVFHPAVNLKFEENGAGSGRVYPPAGICHQTEHRQTSPSPASADHQRPDPSESNHQH